MQLKIAAFSLISLNRRTIAKCKSENIRRHEKRAVAFSSRVDWIHSQFFHIARRVGPYQDSVLRNNLRV